MKSRADFYRNGRAYGKLLLILACFFLYFSSILLISFFFWGRGRRRRLLSKMTRLFSLCLVRIINIRVKTNGFVSPLEARRGIFIVSNHVSYVDGFVLGSLLPLVYVSKSELRSWPLIGLMTEFSGTLFIDRSRKNHIKASLDLMVQVLKEGVHVLIFPEGTSTNGEALLPFKSSFFDVPLNAQAPVMPVSLVYRCVNGLPVTVQNRDKIYWYGTMTFADHFFKLLFCDSIEVEARFHPLLMADNKEGHSMTRKDICDLAREMILKGRDGHITSG